MNKDSKLIFEQYRKVLINELDIGAPDFGAGFGPIKKQIKSAPGGGYLFGLIAKGLNKTPEEAVDILGNKVFNKLFKKQKVKIGDQEFDYFNPSKNEDQFRVQIKDAVTAAIEELKQEYPNLKLPGSDAVKGYTARVIANMGGFVRDYEKDNKFVADKNAIAKVKAVIKKSDNKKVTAAPGAPASAEDNSTETSYQKTDATFIKPFMIVYNEMEDVITVPKNVDFYKSKELRDEVVRATKKVSEKDASDAEFINDFIDSLAYKKAYDVKKGDEEMAPVPDEDDREDTPEDILRDIGAWSRGGGFDEFDKYSSN